MLFFSFVLSFNHLASLLFSQHSSIHGSFKFLLTFYLLHFSLPAGKDSKAEVAPASPVVLVPEEKVSFSLYALSVLTLTVAKIRKSYNKLDSKAIAKQVRRTTSQRIKSHCFNVVVTAGLSAKWKSYCQIFCQSFIEESIISVTVTFKP